MGFRENSDPAEAHMLRASEHSVGRQSLRKGTRSCWDCKRRKVRCVFASSQDTVCSNCRRRGAICASQELPEVLAPPRDQQIGDRIARVEDLVQDLARQVSTLAGTISSQKQPMPNPARTQAQGSQHTVQEPNHARPSNNNARPPILGVSTLDSQRQASSRLGENGNITRKLLTAFPSHQDIDNICKFMCSNTFYFHLPDITSFGSLEREGLTPLKIPSSSAELMDPACHPVLLAKTMLLFSSFLQAGIDNIHGLDEEPHAIVTRLVEAVSTLVTTNEKLHGTMECLECIIYESVFHKTRGNLRKAWQVVRRALLVAQMMGIHRPRPPPIKSLDSSCKTDPYFVWFRILYLDRYLCLLLGLPQGTPYTEMPPDSVLASDGPLDKLSRLQIVIASQILERNEKGPQISDLTLTHEIDRELIRVGKVMPEEFWMVPEFIGVELRSEAEFWEMARISAQMFYYNLVTQLHLPYLLLFDLDPKYDYSRIACMNASREILTRFLASRNFRSTGSCHSALGSLALMASMALLLGHFDSQLHRKVTSVFAHQRRSDRAMMECVLKAVEDLTPSDGSFLDEKNLGALRCLLKIEEDASQGRNYAVRILSGSAAEEELGYGADQKDFAAVTIPIPHFSHITIERQQGPSQDQSGNEFTRFSNSRPEILDVDMDMQQFLVLNPEEFHSESLVSAQGQHLDSETFVSRLPGIIDNETLLRLGDLTDMASGADGWTL